MNIINKKYNLSDYLTYSDLNDLVLYVKGLLFEFEDIIDITDEERYDLDMVVYEENDFVYVEDIDKIERNIMNLSFDFFQPVGYKKNKVWKDSESNVYKAFNYEDMNRMINDINVLIENKSDTSTKFNLNSNVYWGITSDLDWGENYG